MAVFSIRDSMYFTWETQRRLEEREEEKQQQQQQH